MRIGDEEITRDMFPAQIAWQMATPDEHLRQTCQDIFRMNNVSLVPPPNGMGAPAQGTAEVRNDVWETK